MAIKSVIKSSLLVSTKYCRKAVALIPVNNDLSVATDGKIGIPIVIVIRNRRCKAIPGPLKTGDFSNILKRDTAADSLCFIPMESYRCGG
jgi:hypothetical protein